MLFPVRCISCGKVIGHLWDKYDEEVNKKGRDPKEVLDELGVKRYCCRKHFLVYVDVFDDIAVFRNKIIPQEEE
ncbi:MAG: DNA-directed RNA polymerase subunit N [Candidatus Nanohaloarchaeota archaeon]|nr:DNA-directed RNA polymerase subunit N [Candidatus Nanohaloarchaeota archaeon]